MEENFKQSYKGKCKVLHQLMEGYASENVAVAFSGGADSSLLLKLAVMHAGKTGKRVIAVTASTELHPAKDEAAAKQAASEAGAEHRILTVSELQFGGIKRNPADRCYHCKKYLFGAIRDEAAKAGASVVLEGTNADDLKEYRPGLRAVEELGIRSPLKEAGFTKKEVRKLAQEYGISAANRPSAPCLATRFPYGEELTMEKLRRVERGEECLKGLGLYNVRLRVHGNVARIEADAGDMGKLLEAGNQVVRKLKELGYTYITLDLEGFRSGSMDEALPPETFGKGLSFDRCVIENHEK